ncbi:MAG: hypothetical protein U1A22_09770 [Xanthomonadaceae bacterium]|nr:hypothetical protein [Xanthomonadaceae bacterium]
MKVVRFAGILGIATLLLASTAWTQGDSAVPVAVAGAVAAAQPSPAQQEALEAYAASQSSAANGVHTGVERSVVADLDGDGKPEVVAEINWYMGSTSYGRLVVFVEAGYGLWKVAQSEEPLGLVEGIGVTDGLIQVKSRWPGAKDARCCPSLEKTMHYRWQGGRVVEVATEAASAATKK